ncbi:MAG: hypothetical protein LH472_11260 [Pyrinomonadaceae bacterium]|nr:hypothetical protein [Pyrinomonadaceae bacterium]
MRKGTAFPHIGGQSPKILISRNLTATVSESLPIRAEEGLLSTSETTTSNVVRSETLKAQPLRTDVF